MNWTKQMALPATIDLSTEAVLEGVVTNGHRDGAVPESADLAPQPIDRVYPPSHNPLTATCCVATFSATSKQSA